MRRGTMQNIHDNIAVSCKALVKSFGRGVAEVKALRGVDMEVRRGELFMIVGPSGCGKTTLISIVSAILARDGGDCRVFGHDPSDMPPAELARFRGTSIGFVFQVFNLFPALSALENVTVPLLLNGRSQRDARIQAKRMLEAVGLGERADACPAQLSGGQQQRVAIARALVHDPQLIVCDEPTSNLDHQTGQRIMELMRDKAKNADRVVMVVTHDPRIYGFADRIARMDDGRIIDILEGKERDSLL